MSEQHWSKQVHHFYGIYDLSSKQFRVDSVQNSMHSNLFTVEWPNKGENQNHFGVKAHSRIFITKMCLSSSPCDPEKSYYLEGRNIETSDTTSDTTYSYYWILHQYTWIKPLGSTQDLNLHVEFHLPIPRANDGKCMCIPDPDFTFLSMTPPPSLDSLASNLAKQFLREDNADVWFEIGNDVVPAHKWILMARVEVFEKMFETDMQEAKTNRITIEDTDSQTFKQMLKFVYCGEFPEDLKSTADVLLPLAEKYGIQELKDACASTLKTGVKEENALQTLILADVYRCPNLLQHCVKYMIQKPLFRDTLEPLKTYPHLLIELLACMSSLTLK